jgi:hypothetical protein
MATIADLLIEQGRVAAEARQRRGARVGGFVASLGALPGQIMADRAAQQAQAQALAQQQAEAARIAAAEQRAAAEEHRRAELFRLEKATQEDAARQIAAVRSVFAQPGVMKPDGTVNLATALNVAEKMGQPGLKPVVAGGAGSAKGAGNWLLRRLRAEVCLKPWEAGSRLDCR